jgi:hypothetical protein
MSAIEAASVRMSTMADGTLRLVVDIEPRHARDAFGLFGVPGTSLALAALKTPAESAQESAPKPAGGPLAKLAGQWCQMPEFLTWIGCTTSDDAASFIRRACDIASRAELDHNRTAAAAFKAAIRDPFAQHLKDTQ